MVRSGLIDLGWRQESGGVAAMFVLVGGDIDLSPAAVSAELRLQSVALTRVVQFTAAAAPSATPSLRIPPFTATQPNDRWRQTSTRGRDTWTRKKYRNTVKYRNISQLGRFNHLLQYELGYMAVLYKVRGFSVN